MADAHHMVDLAKDSLPVVGIVDLAEVVGLAEPMKKTYQSLNH